MPSKKHPAIWALALVAALVVAHSSVGVGAARRTLLSVDGVEDEQTPDVIGAENELSVSFEAEYPAYDYSESDTPAYSLLSLACPTWEEEEAATRPPLVLSVVMDKSGSMMGDKIRLLKKTTEFLVTRLTDKDKMGIVAYDSEVMEIMPVISMTQDGKDRALGRISEVEASGSTNLSGGLLKGITQQVDDAEEEVSEGPVVRAVLLLTDGLANKGITGSLEIQEAMEDKSADTRMRVFTFGYGSDHDGDLLAEVAEAGSGDYFFIEEDESLPTAFGAVLGGLMATACQNVEVTVTPEDGVEVDALQSWSLKDSEELEGGAFRLTLPDMFADERKDLIIKLLLSPIPETTFSQPLLRASVRYLDTQRRETLEKTAVLSTSRLKSVTDDLPRSMAVLYHRTRLEAADKINEAKAKADEPCLVGPGSVPLGPRPPVYLAQTSSASASPRPSVFISQASSPVRGLLSVYRPGPIRPRPMPRPMPLPYPDGPIRNPACDNLKRAREILSEFLEVLEERKAEAEAADADKDILDGYDVLQGTVETVQESFKDVRTYEQVGKFSARSASQSTRSQSKIAGVAPLPAYAASVANEAAAFVLGKP